MSFLLSIIMVAFSTGAATTSTRQPQLEPPIRVGEGGGPGGGGDQCLAPCTYDEEGNVIDCPCG